MIDYNLFMIYELCWMKLYEKEVVRKENSITKSLMTKNGAAREAGGSRRQAGSRREQGRKEGMIRWRE
jgi:hypothetical protein